MIRFAITAGPSTIAGRGVFAETAIPARAKIGEITGSLISVREARKRAQTRRRIYLIDVSHRLALDCEKGNDFRFLNHNCGSNAFLRIIRNRVEVYARRAIGKGEEITVDYGETPHPGGMTCRCASARCRGRI